MQQLFPEPRAMELDELHADLVLQAGQDRAWVAIDMVASLDGAATLAGRTAELGGEADHHVFTQLRATGDAILVGAGTVREENYGPAAGPASRQADRVARGLAPRPLLVIVSGSLDLDPGHRAFSNPDHRPLVVTTERASADRVDELATVAEVLRLGEEVVDLPALLEELHRRGLPRVLCEGGPRLNNALLDEDLVDEVFLTIAPCLVAGDAPRIVDGPHELPGRGYHLVSVHEHDDELLLRYRRDR
jgi:riboflavin-specific deaminase-like protein